MRPGDNGDDAWEASELGRPIDVESLRADDELIESFRAAVIRAPRSGEASAGRDPEAELRAMLSAWVVDVRPETVATTALPNAPVQLTAASRVADEAVPVPVGSITAARHRAAHPPRYARRFAVAASLIVLLGSGLAVGAWDAQPGGTLWPVAKVFYVERAKSVQAATDVNADLQRARTALDQGRTADAAAAIATVVATLDKVGPAQGHDRLAQRNQELVVALNDPGLLAQAIAATPGATAALAAAPLTDRTAGRTDTPTAAAAPATSGGTPPVGQPADPAPSAAQPPAPLPSVPQPTVPQPTAPLPSVPRPTVPPPASLPSDPPPPATDSTPRADSGLTVHGPIDAPFVELPPRPAVDPRPPAAERPTTGAPAPEPGAAAFDLTAPGATALAIGSPAAATGPVLPKTAPPGTPPTGSSSSTGAPASPTTTDIPTKSGPVTPSDTSGGTSNGSGPTGPRSGSSASRG